jgi:tRNA (cmo5U34)-methyltransferase
MTDGHSGDVERHFTKQWRDYDRQVRDVVPYYDDALSALVAVVWHSIDRPRFILDLGVGTGALAERMLQAFPEARVVGIDLVSDFIEQARDRLQRFENRADLVCADVTATTLPDDCDVVVSSFVFHHLEDDAKRDLCRRIHAALRPGGLLVNLDFVDSASPPCSRLFDDLRIEHMRAAGVEEGVIQTAYIDHRALERPVPMSVQLAWLDELGYVDTECYWKYLNLAMVGGRK